MRVSLAPLALGSLVTFGTFAASSAFAGEAAAQSGPPGQCACTPPPQAFEYPAYPAYPGAAMPAPAPEPWEANRFGVGLRLSGVSLGERASDGADEQKFSMGGLVARYRASRRIELELAFEGGEEQLEEEGYTSDYQLTTATASMLVHMRPQAEWDWYLLGGLGVNDRRYKGDSDDYADQRSHIALGIGIEHRWEHLVIGAELRGLAVSPPDEEDNIAEPPPPEPFPVPQPAPTASTVVVDDRDEANVGGAQFSVSATWFF